MSMTPGSAVMLVMNELRKATEKFPPFHNAHEGYAVLMEEVDELWDTVKMNQENLDRQGRMRAEAIQVAAMAIRFLVDICDTDLVYRPT